MAKHFLEIVFQDVDFTFGGLDRIVEPLDEALGLAGIGQATGSGSGGGESSIDVYVADLDRGLAIIRQVLQGLGVAGNTVILQYEQQGNKQVRIMHQLYE
jgi:hypothetical protein